MIFWVYDHITALINTFEYVYNTLKNSESKLFVYDLPVLNSF